MKEHFQKPVKKVKTKGEVTGDDVAKAMMSNSFLKASTKKDARTWNNAVSNSSTGDLMVDDFAKSGSYRGRDTETVFADASKLWNVNPELALKLFLYLRLITRKIKGFFASDKVQKGQGNKDESLRRLLWVAYNHPGTFYNNLWLIPLVGTWKDLWTLMGIDFNNELSHAHFFELMIRGLNDKDMRALVIKYMPQIKAHKKCTTPRARILNELAKEFALYMKMSYKDYRKFKSTNGEAHRWQQLLSKGYYDQIDFNTIPGKALTLLVKGNFLTKHKLVSKYEKWIDSQPVAKFTGYVYELFKQVNYSLPSYKRKTINKQFDGLVALGKKDGTAITGNVWCALDTSGSMASRIAGDITAYDVCISLGIYFSALNEGAFKDHVIMFDDVSRKLQLKGTFIDKAMQITNAKTAWGSTNFQSVIDEIVRIRKTNPDIPIEDYPETLLVVSDMQFNPANTRKGGYGWSAGQNYGSEQTNYETAMQKLAAVGLPPIKIIWWQVNGRNTTDFPSTIDDKGTYVISGFDGAIVSVILGGKSKTQTPNMVEVMHEALNQEVLTLVKV